MRHKDMSPHEKRVERRRQVRVALESLREWGPSAMVRFPRPQGLAVDHVEAWRVLADEVEALRAEYAEAIEKMQELAQCDIPRIYAMHFQLTLQEWLHEREIYDRGLDEESTM